MVVLNSKFKKSLSAKPLKNLLKAGVLGIALLCQFFPSNAASISEISPLSIELSSFGLEIANIANYIRWRTDAYPKRPRLRTSPPIDKIYDFTMSEDLYEIGDRFPVIVLPLTFLFYVIPSSGDYRKKAFVYMETQLMNAGITGLMKVSIGRKRPASSDPLSFPSGHSSSIFAWASFVGTDFYRMSNTALGKISSLFIPYGLAFFVGASRIGGRRHYFTDVAVGAVIGTLVGYQMYDFHFDNSGKYRQGLLSSSDVVVIPEFNIKEKSVALKASFSY